MHRKRIDQFIRQEAARGHRPFIFARPTNLVSVTSKMSGLAIAIIRTDLDQGIT